MPVVIPADDVALRCEAAFIVVRIMRDGTMDVFATGRYLDRVEADSDGNLRLRERIVVCDGNRFDTLVAIPL
jgi:3-phenylpropionate/cinnamic acid dioxygenase small subunit